MNLFLCTKCIYFAKLETEFREIILSGNVNETVYLNERIVSSYYSEVMFLYHHELHQSTNMYNDDGNKNRIGRTGTPEQGAEGLFALSKFSVNVSFFRRSL